MKIVVASNNPHKLKELNDLYGKICRGYSFVPQSDFDIPSCPEPHETFIENALEKARHASRMSDLPALADDSGICATALGGAPGVHSAYYGGDQPRSDIANNLKLTENLAGHLDKTVKFTTVLVFVRHPEDPEPIISQASNWGVWLDEPRGEGFGYDTHFFDPKEGATFSEMTVNRKNSLSSRGSAAKSMLVYLEQYAFYVNSKQKEEDYE